MQNHLFVAIGDTHLQQSSPRNPDRLRSLDQIIEENIHRPDLAAWLWPGDLTHARSTPQDRWELGSRAARMASRAPVIICRGNHDPKGELEFYSLIHAAHPVHVVTSIQTLHLRLATGATASVFICPYPDLASLVAAGAPSAEVFQQARAVLEDLFDFGASELADARGRGELTLAMGHCAISGARMSNAQPAIGREVEIDGALLTKLGNIPKMWNHIHEPQEIFGAHFVGSITAQDFGEITPRRYLRMHMRDDAGYDAGWSVESCPLDTPRMFHVEGRLTRDEFHWRVVAGRGGPEQVPAEAGALAIADWSNFDWSGCDVRVRYHMLASERPVLNECLVTETFRAARHLQLDPVIESDRSVRAPEVAAATTLPDKVRAVLTSNGQPWTDRRQDKVARLEHHDPEAFIADVRVSIATAEGVSSTIDVSVQTHREAMQEALL
jgi:DNA repair exonuclease SbcCD nuclease subunit